MKEQKLIAQQIGVKQFVLGRDCMCMEIPTPVGKRVVAYFLNCNNYSLAVVVNDKGFQIFYL